MTALKAIKVKGANIADEGSHHRRRTGGVTAGQLLHACGIDNIILERQTPDYVLGRIRAGLLEEGTVALLDEVGAGARAHREGLVHNGIELTFGGTRHRIDMKAATGKTMTIYGQTEVTLDLMNARRAAGPTTVYEAADVKPLDFDTDHPRVSYIKDGVSHEVACDFIAGCDGFHGVSRASVKPSAIETFERIYPFGWLGILSETPPVSHELIYSNHARGFALCSMRSTHRSRYYVQCGLDDHIDQWPDDRFWDELKRRLDQEAADISSPDLRSKRASRRCAVSSPSRCGSGACSSPATPRTSCRRPAPRGSTSPPATCIISPSALREYYDEKSSAGIDGYSAKALARVWKAVRFSWWMTSMMHRFPDTEGFGARIQLAELNYLIGSKAATTSLSENYVGLPY